MGMCMLTKHGRLAGGRKLGYESQKNTIYTHQYCLTGKGPIELPCPNIAFYIAISIAKPLEIITHIKYNHCLCSCHLNNILGLSSIWRDIVISAIFIFQII